MKCCILKGTAIDADAASGTPRMETNELLGAFANKALANNGRVLLKSDARISPDHVAHCDKFVLYASDGSALIGDVAGAGQSYSPDIWPSPSEEPYQPISAFAGTGSKFWVKLDNVVIYTTNFPAWKYVKDDDEAVPLDQALKVRGKFSVIYARSR